MYTRKHKLVLIAIASCLASAIPLTPSAWAEETGPAFAAPAPGVSEKIEIGPGVSTPADHTNDYYMQTLASPIVLETEPYTYNQISTDLQTLLQTYPDHMKLNSLGRTHDSRELYEVLVGNPYAPKQVLIQAGIHGRESITSLLVMKQLEYVLACYDTGMVGNRKLSDILNDISIRFIPMMNPDGISISQLGEGGIGSEELRQTIRNAYQYDLSAGRTSAPYETYLTLWKSNARGVDLNHNFDASWNDLTATSSPSSSDYRGSAPLSEPESAALDSVVRQNPVKVCINYHAMGQVLYWDVEGNRQKDKSLLLAQNFAQATGYQILNSLGRGGAKDWLQIQQNAIPSITVEIGRVACPVPVSEFPDIWTKNRSGIALALDFAQTQTN